MQYEDFAKVYDELMLDVDYDTWSYYIKKFIGNSSSILECACGTGEITWRLANMGYSVIASDVSMDMLRVAHDKILNKGMRCRNVQFVNMDMKRLSIHHPVDCVVACCDGVNYLTVRSDVESFFLSAHKALKTGGLLLFDISSRYKLQEILGNNTFADHSKSCSYIWQNCYDETSKLIEMNLSFFVKRGELYQRFDETHIQRAHSVREITSWLENCGFGFEMFECFTNLEPSLTCERIQFVARKV